jgi:hypothetical protein
MAAIGRHIAKYGAPQPRPQAARAPGERDRWPRARRPPLSQGGPAGAAGPSVAQVMASGVRAGVFKMFAEDKLSLSEISAKRCATRRAAGLRAMAGSNAAGPVCTGRCALAWLPPTLKPRSRRCVSGPCAAPVARCRRAAPGARAAMNAQHPVLASWDRFGVRENLHRCTRARHRGRELTGGCGGGSVILAELRKADISEPSTGALACCAAPCGVQAGTRGALPYVRRGHQEAAGQAARGGYRRGHPLGCTACRVRRWPRPASH